MWPEAIFGGGSNLQRDLLQLGAWGTVALSESVLQKRGNFASTEVINLIPFLCLCLPFLCRGAACFPELREVQGIAPLSVYCRGKQYS